MEHFDLLLRSMKPTTLARMYANLLEVYTTETSPLAHAIREQLVALAGEHDAYNMIDAAIDAG